MSADGRDLPPPAAGPGSVDLEKLLEERARLEELIRKKFTRIITVMFTDFKGSTAIAEAEGDMAARLLIKKHHDILFPILRENRGVLVKTMGDGTMSWFDKAQDGVRTAVRFQRALKAFNGERPGKTPVIVRIGLNTGQGIVEETDIFGDVVNVAARFESIAEPGGICISESCREALDDRDEFHCRFARTTEIKGKTGQHQVYRIVWDDEAEEARRAGESPDPATGVSVPKPGIAPSAGPMPSKHMAHIMRGAFVKRPVVEPRKKQDIGKIQEEREAAGRAVREIASLVVPRGDVYRMVDEGYRVLDDIVVEPGALLVIENARLFFAEGAGIVSSGSFRARNALFSAIEPAKGWRNVAIDPREEKVSHIEGCTFRFGKGRTWGAPGADSGERHARINDTFLYGGGLLVRRATEKTLTVKDCVFHRCSAHDGGGMLVFDSRIVVTGCTFDRCAAGTSGGGIFCLEASPSVVRCSFNDCTAGKGGGGMGCHDSYPAVAGCTFENCATGFLFGGGLLCESSSPNVSNSRFIRCRASKGGGGISCDEGSAPRTVQTTFTDCVPNATNCGTLESVSGKRGSFL